MPRIKTVNQPPVGSKTATLFAAVEKKLGKVPNMMRAMANSPAVLEAYLGFSNTLNQGVLSARLREQIALAVGDANDCQYCLAAHTALGELAGLNGDEIIASRRGESADAKVATALAFARTLVRAHGNVADVDVQRLRRAGFDDAAVAEIVACVALNLFTNYFNHVAATEIDFPEVAPLKTQPASAC